MSKSISAAEVKTVIFACEAGMGSSLMSVNSLKKKLKAAQITDVNVIHKPVHEVPADGYPIPYESARLVKAAVAAVLLFGLVVILRTGAPVTDLFTAVAATLSYPAILWAWRFLNPAEMASVRHVALLLTRKVTGAPKVRQ